MAEYLIQDTTLDAIADAINAKTGGSSAMTPAEMVTAIGSISGGGGGGQGIRDLTFDYTYSGGLTTSGVIENNSFHSVNIPGSYYILPLMLIQPISLSSGDEIDVTVKNPNNIGTNVSIVLLEIFYRVISARGFLSIMRNKAIRNTTTYHYVYTGSGTVVDTLGIFNDGGALTDASAEISLSINGVTLF